MDFIKHLKETKESLSTKRIMNGWGDGMMLRAFEQFQVGENTFLSIQASYAHYCTPRKTLDDLTQYKTMEFALIGESGDFLRVTEVLPNFHRLEEIEQYEDTVYGFVPVELIDELYSALKRD